jgi:predicted small metal-binding protein
MRCVACRRPLAFGAGEAAAVLRHTAYGFDFAHEGPCVETARSLIFAEPGYDCVAFGRDAERRRVLGATDAAGWAAVLAETPERVVAGHPVRFEPLRWWALVEHRNGTRCVEGVVRDDAWLDEPGGAEVPAARRGPRPCLGYAALVAAAGRAATAPGVTYLYGGPTMPSAARRSVGCEQLDRGGGTMAKVLKCADVTGACPEVVREQTEAEVLRRAAEHARGVHGVQTLPTELVVKVKAAIRGE